MAALIATIGAIPLASAGWPFLPAMLVPLVVALWAWRAGTDADADGLRLRAVLGQRLVPWSSIAELGGDPRGRAVARLVDGGLLRLPAVRAKDLTRLVTASGRETSTGRQASRNGATEQHTG